MQTHHPFTVTNHPSIHSSTHKYINADPPSIHRYQPSIHPSTHKYINADPPSIHRYQPSIHPSTHKYINAAPPSIPRYQPFIHTNTTIHIHLPVDPPFLKINQPISSSPPLILSDLYLHRHRRLRV